MELYHFTEKMFTLDRTRKYEPRTPLFPMKPGGLWLSDESDYGWKAWCEAESFGSLAHVYKCIVNMEDILHLSTSKELEDFTHQYPFVFADPRFKKLNYFKEQIDWVKVMKTYTGIVITPYVYESRFTLMWYYVWDCASGCVWNLDAIESIDLVN